MKTLLLPLLLLSLACNSRALRCHTCAASSEDECNKQGSTVCPQYADACATITGTNAVLKSCTYKAFCEKARGSSSAAKMECCFGENCNGPHQGHSHWDHRHNSAGPLLSSPALLVAAVLLLTCSQV